MIAYVWSVFGILLECQILMSTKGGEIPIPIVIIVTLTPETSSHF